MAQESLPSAFGGASSRRRNLGDFVVKPVCDDWEGVGELWKPVEPDTFLLR